MFYIFKSTESLQKISCTSINDDICEKAITSCTTLWCNYKKFYDVFENVFCEGLQLETDVNQAGFYGRNFVKVQRYDKLLGIEHRNFFGFEFRIPHEEQIYLLCLVAGKV